MKNVYWQVMRAIWLTAAIIFAGNAMAKAISYNERFALDDNRQAALAELIPGTEDYYYYNALHLELKEDLVEAKKMIDDGVKKYGHSTRLRELENRYALKVYKTNPAYSLKYLVRHLNLNFNHRQKKLGKEVHLPTELNPKVIAFDTLAKYGFQEHRNTNRFEESAFDYLVAAKLTADQRRSLLSRLRRPDYPGIVQLIINDLDYKHSKGFGHHQVHRMLTVEQLEECLEVKPELIKQTHFINTYLTKLRPNNDVDWKADDKEHEAYLKRLLAFSDRLPLAYNSLKANIIYKQLQYNIRKGIYDKNLFIRYIKMPRPVHYINPKLLNTNTSRGTHVDLNASHEAFLSLSPIGNDERVVRRHLMHLLKTAPTQKEYTDYIEYNYLKRLFAEIKLVNSIGDAEKWYALMDSPSMVKNLRDRIDIEILPTNKKYLEPNEKVVLEVGIKNIKDLTVKIYDINTTGYYRQNLSPITTTLELDGLVPNRKTSKKYSHPPMQRHIETLAFPEINKPGVYVVELIGNGVSSRAVIRKGRLSYTERIGAAGHVFQLYDEKQNLLTDAVVWMAGTEYQATDGEIHVPFSGKPKKQSIVFSHQGFSVLRQFQHLGENYALKAGMYLGREQLIEGKKCMVTVRPELLLNGEPVDITLLEDPILTIRSHDLDGHAAEKQINDFKLNNKKESTYTFRVPKRFRSMDIILSGKVQNLNTGKKVNLSTHTTIAANQIKETPHIEDVFLRQTAKGYMAELLGRNGEALKGRALHLQLKHRDFKRIVKTSLKTDTDGRTHLGELKDIVLLSVRTPEKTGHTWWIPQDKASPAPLLHMLAHEKLRIPIMHTDTRPLNKVVSFLETRSGVFVRDCINNIRQEGGYLVINGLPAGDYSLMTKPDGKITTIRVTKGKAEGSLLLGKNRILEKKASFPLQIQDIEVKGENVIVKVANSVPGTRVHISMTRYITDDLFDKLGYPSFRQPTAAKLNHPKSQYLSGRRIGDEYRYVMERKSGATYPGNMLTRPSLLLNPWSPRTTDLGSDHAAAGEVYSLSLPQSLRSEYDEASTSESPASPVEPDQFSSFDFLEDISPMVMNLVPDKNGVVKLPVKNLQVGQHLHVYAVNSSTSVYRQRPLQEHSDTLQDLRLTRHLDPKKHFTEQKRTSIIRKKESFTVKNILSSKFETIDSISSAYRLFTALNDDTTLAEFNFIINWPEHSEEKKKELYKKYGCHELHLFLAMKDPVFFKKIVLPYIANKKDLTFLDEWLLQRPLDSYLEPWSYSRLNMVERALLAQQVKSQQKSTSRHLKDLYDLLPPDIERFNTLFDSTLRSSGLEDQSSKLGLLIEQAASLEEPMVEGAGDAAESGDVVLVDILSAGKPPSAPMPAAARAMSGGAKPKKSAKRSKQRLMKGQDKPLPPSEIKEAEYASKKNEQNRARDAKRRESTRQLYKKLEKTKEWVENNYYHKIIHDQIADLVGINGFWKDYANWNGRKKFLSGNLPEAGNSFTEILLALAVLDLPFKAGEHDYQYKEGGMVFTAANDLILFHKQVQQAEGQVNKAALLINQSFFARDDRYRYDNNERFDKFVENEFEKGRVYGCQLVITNPTSTRRKVDILQQIPSGAIVVLGGMQTQSRHAVLQPYSTQSQEYYFYFPREGEFPHYPVHVAQNEKIVAAADPFVFKVVSRVDRIDKGSWEHVSQFGSEKEVINFMNSHNINRLNLEMIAWRMREKDFLQETFSLLADRKVYNSTLWSYSLYHNMPKRIGEYLVHTPLVNNIGKNLQSPLLNLDAIEHRLYEHKEYWPLVNARVFKLGNKRKILNRQFYEQYESYMKTMTYRLTLSEDEKMAVVVYMLLQDRIEEAIAFYKAIDPTKLQMMLQYDYLSAYLAFYQGAPDKARAIAMKYQGYPVDRWHDLFAEVVAQSDEINGGNAAVIDSESRSQAQTLLAETMPRLQLDIKENVVEVEHGNLTKCTVNYYPMNIELLFSRKPFVQDVGTQFTFIKPHHSGSVKLTGDKAIKINIPEKLKDQNLMIEVTAAGISRLKAYYPNALKVDILESYGQLRVADTTSTKGLSHVYVKVYARTGSGEVKFYKDGYTDLRGRFDYTSLNSDTIDSVNRFAILILSDNNGAMVREVGPPKR